MSTILASLMNIDLLHFLWTFYYQSNMIQQILVSLIRVQDSLLSSITSVDLLLRAHNFFYYSNDFTRALRGKITLSPWGESQSIRFGWLFQSSNQSSKQGLNQETSFTLYDNSWRAEIWGISSIVWGENEGFIGREGGPWVGTIDRAGTLCQAMVWVIIVSR